MLDNKTVDDFEFNEDIDESESDFIRYDITSYPADMTLKVYFDKWRDKQLVPPDFQRNFIWDIVQASRLIESFLIGIPVPGVFLYKEQRTNRLLVIDGHQRIQSIIRYFSGKFDDRVFRLKGVMNNWNGKTYDELDVKDKYQLQDAILRATVVQQQHPDDHSSIYHIFERLNTGGVKLSPMEIRKCVFEGGLFRRMEELNRNRSWRRILGQNVVDKRLRDVEMVLRVLALSNDWMAYEKPMKRYLNRFINDHQARTGAVASDVENLALAFDLSCDMIVRELGDKPFHLRGRLNLGMLDCFIGTVIRYHDTLYGKLAGVYNYAIHSEEFLQSVTYNTSDSAVVKMRFEILRQFCSKI